MVFVLNKGMVHIQYLKIDQAVEKKKITVKRDVALGRNNIL